MSNPEIKIDKLDFEALYEEAEQQNRFGECAACEEEHMLCFCGVCFKYCHDDYFHEMLPYDPYDSGENYFGLTHM